MTVIIKNAAVDVRSWVRMVCLMPALVGIGCWIFVHGEKSNPLDDQIGSGTRRRAPRPRTRQ